MRRLDVPGRAVLTLSHAGSADSGWKAWVLESSSTNDLEPISFRGHMVWAAGLSGEQGTVTVMCTQTSPISGVQIVGVKRAQV